MTDDEEFRFDSFSRRRKGSNVWSISFRCLNIIWAFDISPLLGSGRYDMRKKRTEKIIFTLQESISLALVYIRKDNTRRLMIMIDDGKQALVSKFLSIVHLFLWQNEAQAMKRRGKTVHNSKKK